MNKTIEFTKKNNPIYFVCPYCGNRIEENNLKIIVSSDNNLNSYVDLSVKCNICGQYMNKTYSPILSEVLENFASKGYIVEEASEGFTGYAKYEYIDYPILSINAAEKYSINPDTKKINFGYIDFNHIKDTLNSVDTDKNIVMQFDTENISYNFGMKIYEHSEENIKKRDDILKTILEFSKRLK